MWSQSSFEWISLKANASSMEWIIVKPHSFPACVYPERDEIQSCPDLFAVCGYREGDALISDGDRPNLSNLYTYRNSSTASWLPDKKSTNGNTQLSVRALSTASLFFRSFIYNKKIRNLRMPGTETYIRMSHEWSNQRHKRHFLLSSPPPTFSFQLPTIYPDHVWHMAATDLHASIMLDAIVLEGGREREWYLQYVPMAPSHGAVFASRGKVVMKGVSVHFQIGLPPL